MVESSAVAFIVRGALRADRLAVRPLSAQCGAALRSISAAVRSILTAVRSIFTPHCGRFPPFSTAVRSANTAQGYRSAVEFRRTATSPSNRAPPSYWETPSYAPEALWE